MADALLSGTTIVEIAHPLTEYAGLVLAGLGAEVYLVEPPAGSSTRLRRPFVEGMQEARRSVPFLARNLGKRSVAIDLRRGADRDLLAALVARADALLACASSRLDGDLAGLPASVRVTITDPEELGSSAIVHFAASGGMSSSGWPHQPPCNAPSWLALDGVGIYAAAMTLVGLRLRSLGGPPVSYEIPASEASLAAMTPWTRPLHSYGMSAAGQGATSARMGAGPYPILRCADGYIRFLVSTPRQWQALLRLLGNPSELSAPDWENLQFRVANFELLVAVAAEIVADQPMIDVFLRGQSYGLTITPVFDVPRFLEDPHVTAREFFQTLADPDLGAVRVPRPPYRLPSGGEVVWRPAPGLGQDRPEAEAFAASPIDAPPAANTATLDPAAPLRGVRILSFGVGAVVPEAASLLALLGAEVIKVESRRHVDFLRQVGLGGPGDMNNSASFNQMNLGVLSLAVDMNTEEGRGVIRRLIPLCDVVMENMRGTVMGKWGLDYESVRALRPDVIYWRSQGLGDGPYGGFQTFGPNLQTFSGVTSLWAHPDDPYPTGTTLNHPDHVAGKQALAPLLAALARRERSGEGTLIDSAQFETAAALIGDRFLQHQLQPGTVQPIGNASPDMAPHGCYPCAGDDLWCAIAVEDDRQWQQFVTVIDEPWARDPGLIAASARVFRSAELDGRLAGWTSRRTQDEVEQALRGAGVPVSRVRRGDDLAADTAAHENGFFACVPHPTAGARWHTGLPVRDAGFGRFATRRAPLLGEHDEYVLFELLHLDVHEVNCLVSAGAVGH